MQCPRFDPDAAVSQAAVESFTRELANLVGCGITALQRCNGFVGRFVASAKNVWSAIHDDVVGGISLAEAMARWSVFPTSTSVMKGQPANRVGFLAIVLQQIADCTCEQDLKGKVKAALVYPCVLAVFAIAVVTFCSRSLSRNSVACSEFGGKLPALTLMIVASQAVMISYGWGCRTRGHRRDHSDSPGDADRIRPANVREDAAENAGRWAR